MDRRSLLAATTASSILYFSGCIAGRESAEDADQSDRSKNENSTSWSDCSFNVEIIEDAPDNAEIVSAERNRLLESDIIARVFDRASDPNSDFREAKRRSGRYEKFSVSPNSEEEFEFVKNQLASLPRFRDSDYPPGVYITNGEVTVAITEECLA